jgi:hypothetical protein
LQALVDRGELSFQVARMAEGDDPAFLVIKTLTVEYTFNGKLASAQGTDPETLSLGEEPVLPLKRIAEIKRDERGKLLLEAWEAGRYEIELASGGKKALTVSQIPASVQITGPWNVQFGVSNGAALMLPELVDWSKHPEPSVKYFSGPATYEKEISLAPDLFTESRRVWLDLGEVAVMAQVEVNGQDFGILWKRPFAVDITRAVRPGQNRIKIRVVNLWVNRLIGDEQLPEDSERNADGTLKAWPSWLIAKQPSPTGRRTFTSWRLWKKDSPLQKSGLLGPVTIQSTAQLGLN